MSPICGISDPSHTIRPGEGSLYTVLLMLCSHNLHASATFSNTRSVKKSLTGFLTCATWDQQPLLVFPLTNNSLSGYSGLLIIKHLDLCDTSSFMHLAELD